MLPYTLDYTIEKITKDSSNKEQKALKKLTGKSLSEKEAGKIWSGVQDHKWYVSERLGRDIGFRVAAVDFIENVYQAKADSKHNLHRTSQPGFMLA